jgi:hypothetical protein
MDRQLMVRAIRELAGDELETIEDAMKIAMETEWHLVNRLIGLALHYKYESEKLKKQIQ